MEKATIAGYGPADLIEQLEKAEWESLDGGGRNFFAIGLAGYCLTEPRDNLCNIKYRATVKNMDSGKEFSVEGFCFQSALLEFSLDPQEKEDSSPNQFAGHRLLKEQQDGQASYSVTLEIIG